jgi:hypothetical protein
MDANECAYPHGHPHNDVTPEGEHCVGTEVLVSIIIAGEKFEKSVGSLLDQRTASLLSRDLKMAVSALFNEYKARTKKSYSTFFFEFITTGRLPGPNGSSDGSLHWTVEKELPIPVSILREQFNAYLLAHGSNPTIVSRMDLIDLVRTNLFTEGYPYRVQARRRKLPQLKAVTVRYRHTIPARKWVLSKNEQNFILPPRKIVIAEAQSRGDLPSAEPSVEECANAPPERTV